MKLSLILKKHLSIPLSIILFSFITFSCATEDNTSESSSIFEGLASWGIKARSPGGDDVIVTGFGYGDVSTDSGSSESDIFLARHDSSGDFDWLVQPGSSNEDFATAMVISTDVYVAGYTYGELETGAAQGGADCFIMQIDPANGNQDWVQQYGTEEDDFCWGITTDGTNLFVVGNTEGTFTGSTNIQGNDIFILSVDMSGDTPSYAQWGKDTAINSNVYSQSHGVAIVYDGGNLIIGGVTNDSLGGTKIGGNDLVFAQYTTGLVQGWTTQIGTAYDDSIGDMVFSTDLYVTGFSYGTPDASYDYSAAGYSEDNNTTEVSVYSIDDTNGNQNWVSQIGSSGYDRGYGIAVNGSNIYVTGNTAGDLATTNAGSYDFFIASFDDTSGDINWKFQYGSDVYDTATGIALDAAGDIMITGRTYGTLYSQSNDSASFSSFVIKYDDASPDTGPIWTKVY